MDTKLVKLLSKFDERTRDAQYNLGGTPVNLSNNHAVFSSKLAALLVAARQAGMPCFGSGLSRISVDTQEGYQRDVKHLLCAVASLQDGVDYLADGMYMLDVCENFDERELLAEIKRLAKQFKLKL